MASNTASFKASELVQDFTMWVTIRGMRTVRIRIWLACQLIKLAAVIAPIRIELMSHTECDTSDEM